MPITVKLDDLLHARRMTLTELSERIDLTLSNLSILKTGKARAPARIRGLNTDPFRRKKLCAT